ncbi:unnamed protein product [Candidula unifasciata]|uniref:Fatty acid synthase n=1 Tax=Candidula unifasciata TaxID=100452 RepID=A0A8S3ZCV9_9EUPU|nr:unnamed protein product [Candidula unifasciata]
MSQESRDKVAIIGVGCKFPGANSLEEFWRVLENGENHVIEIPETRWFHEAFYDSDFNTPAKTHARKAGLLKDHLAFDNKLFNIKDVEADIMDPQQRYVLECCHRALEDAGITRDQIKGSNTSVYMGAMNQDYRSEFNAPSMVPDNYAVTGVSSSIIANRVSFVYDLRGSSVTLDTACSSSLVAIDLGYMALKAGVCDMAICGGVSSILCPDLFIHLSKARMVSAKGQCFAFSDQVDGYTRGEGCGVVILKRYQDAIKDKNKIWATIDSFSNQDGGTVTPMSKPSGEQQVRLLEEIYSRNRIDPKRLAYIEAHGTGTVVGDFTEVNALGKFFKIKQAEQYRYLGSVKTNIGHLESAAGSAGLIKVLLMMKHSKIVPSLHFDRPNPNIDFNGFNLRVPTKVIAWQAVTKLASVSSYGFGGTNCHAIIESHGQPPSISSDVKAESIVCFSAMNLESLKGSMKDFVNYPNVQSMNIEDLSLTSTRHRDHFSVRQAFVANTTESLLGQVVDEMAKVKHDSTDARKPKIVFVFSGMGTAWAGMGRDYMSNSKVFRDKIREIDKFLGGYVPWTVEDRLCTEYDTNDEMFWPIAICACQIATAHLWMSLGVTPDCTVGSSVGEVAAAHIAGRVSLSDTVKVIYHRSKLLARLVGSGRMILFRGVGIEDVDQIVNKWPGKANVSVRTSPRTCAVSGQTDIIAAIEDDVRKLAKLQKVDIEVIDLNLPLAYHSHCVDGCKDELRQALNGTGPCLSAAGIDMISSVTGEFINGPVNAEYWVDNVREPVLIMEALKKSFIDEDNTVYIEVGSKPLMAAHTDDIFPGKNVKVVVSMRSKGTWKTFLEALAKAYKHGCSVDWKNLPQSGHLLTAVPRYSFNPRRCLHHSETSSMTMAGINFLKRDHPFVFPVESTNKHKVFLTLATFRSVFDHKVAGQLIIPGALYVECGFALSKQISLSEAEHYSVSATFEQACHFTEKEPVVFTLDVSASQTIDTSSSFKSYRIAIMHHKTRFATVQLHPHYAPKDKVAVNIPQVMIRCQELFNRNDIYDKLTRFGFNYGPLYKLLYEARKGNEECIVRAMIPDELVHECAATIVHPSLLDVMIQTFIVLLEESGDRKELLPISIGKVTPYRTFEKQMYIYTTVKDRYGKMIIFDSKLTTLDGDIIVEMEDLTLKFLSAETSNDEHSTEHISRSHWVMKVPDYPYTQQTDPQILYMSNESVPPEVTSIEYSIDEDCSETIIRHMDSLKKNRILDTFRLIIFNISFKFDESVEAAVIQSKIVNLCMVLKSVFCFPLKIPVHVFTRWALPAEYSSSNRDNINPVMTSVWGMIRSAIQEQAADISVFDLHLPQAQCSLDRMTSISNFVHKNEDLKRFNEWLVTENRMFVHEIISLTNNTVPVFRHISADRHKHVLQVSNGPLGSTETFCVYDESEICGNSQNNLEINVTDSVILHPKLFNLSVPYSTMVPHRSHLGNGSVVFVLETRGKQDDTSENGSHWEIMSCYPSPMGSQISVPAEATVPREMFEDYTNGDLVRLSVLMTLSEYIKGNSLTILTSSSTKGFGQILCDILAFKDKKQTRHIQLLTPEQVESGQSLNRTVVSLVLLDASLVSTLINHWPQAECLVTVAPLVSQSVNCVITYHFPDIKVIVIDPSEIFQPRNLLELIPQVKEFLSCHRHQVSKCLSGGDRLTDRFPEVTADLNDLLKVQAVKVNRSSVRVDHHYLFKQDAVYVVVGGLTGLGWVTVRFLTSQGAGNIAILNRRAPGEAKTREINELCQQSACNIQCFQCDVCDKDSLSNVLNVSIAIEFPNRPLKGIFFGAAVEGDAMLSNVTREHLENMMSPKVLGAWNAHTLTEDHDLDYFILQSSVTSVIGNVGQTSYGAANAFLDGLATFRRHRNLPGQSINWGALNLGMLTNNEKAKQNLTQRGMKLLTEEEIQEMIIPILLLDSGQTVACSFDSDLWRKNALATAHGSTAKTVNDKLRHALQKAPQLPQQDRLDIYTDLLTAVSANIIGIDESLLQPDSDLPSLGMDSLLAMTIRNEVFKITQCRIPAVILVSGEVTVRILAETLDLEVQTEISQRK